MRYLLVGNYGTGNFGDESLKAYFLSAFPEAEWRVLSAHPEKGELPRLPAGVRSLLLTPWWKTIGALRSSDGLVFGGGTLFTDIESLRACLLWWWHAFLCWIFRKPFFLAFQGIGPFRTRMGEWCARWVVRRARFLSVRDSASVQRVQTWNMNTNIVQTSDPVFSLFAAKEKTSGSQKLLVIIPRKNSPVSFGERAQSLWRSGSWMRVRILSLEPEDRREQEACRSIAHALSVPASDIIPIRSVDILVEEICAAGFVLSQRYHGALAALARGVPFEAAAQGEGDKLSALSTVPPDHLAALVSSGTEALRRVLFPT